MLATMEKTGRTEFRKVLARHRQDIQDAKKGSRGPPVPLRDQMVQRIAELEAALKAVSGS